MNIVEEIKNRLNIIDLTNMLGINNSKKDFIFSIYKNETNPSLKLYVKTNSYYCFSTGKGGDVINFFADYNGISNNEAIKILKSELGINNQFNLPTQVGEKINEERNIEIYHSLETYFNGADDRTIDYLKSELRGLSDNSIKKFRLFSIKNVNETIDRLLNSYSLIELKLSGLFNEQGRFVFTKHRVIIPYLQEDKIVYLRGRLLPEYEKNGISKYIGLSGKSAKRLFNTNVINKLPENSEILLCEGEFDAIRADQAGIKAIGIPGINNFPDNIAKLLSKFDIYICFDNDAAGKEGMRKVTNSVAKKITGLFLQKHKDLTEYFNQTGNANLLKSESISLNVLEPSFSVPVPETKSKLVPISAYDLQKMKIPPIRWVVENILPEGLSMLAGRPKSGKSWMALAIALSVAKGGKVLNKFNSIKGSVLYLALEDSNRRMQDRINNILGAEFDKTFPDNLLLFHNDAEFPKLNNGGLEALNCLIEDYENLRLIIIDTFGRSVKDEPGKNKNIYLADYELMSSIQKFALEKRIAVLLLHHTKKGKEDNPFDEISGTTGITGALDTMIMIKKNAGKNCLYFTGRDVLDGEFQIEFEQTSCLWQIIEEKKEKNLTAERQEIIDLFMKYNRKMKTGEVAELIAKEKSNVSKLLKKLLDDNILYSPCYGAYALVEKEIEPEEDRRQANFDLFKNTAQSGQRG